MFTSTFVATALATTLAVSCQDRFNDDTVWGRLVHAAVALEVADAYPRYESIAWEFTDCVDPDQWDRFWSAHDAGNRRRARRVLRDWAGY